ncbi:protein of unknown function [Methylocaldum szegediense]|uniref:Uncharacterized protein n=2 Tax=Methylocaldum szegediense TaxID=73780 RepID=A0ABN8XAE1_9GAMM|nr:protein of unknown function [Methylocaldum szegediense]
MTLGLLDLSRKLSFSCRSWREAAANAQASEMSSWKRAYSVFIADGRLHLPLAAADRADVPMSERAAGTGVPFPDTGKRPRVGNSEHPACSIEPIVRHTDIPCIREEPGRSGQINVENGVNLPLFVNFRHPIVEPE